MSINKGQFVTLVVDSLNELSQNLKNLIKLR